MVTTEFDPSKRDFLLSFARRGRGGGQPPRRPTAVATAQAEPPDRSNGLINRRNFLRVGSGVVGGVVGLFIADRLGLLGFLHRDSEKRKRGIQLENLQFNTQTGMKLEKDKFYSFGKINIQQSTTNYDLTFNQQQLAYVAERCGVNNIPEGFQMIISERYASYNNRGQLEELEAETTSDGVIITTFIGLDTLFINGVKLIDQQYDISPERRTQAEANFNVLDLNHTLMRIMCAATIASELDRKGALRQESERAIEKASQIADEYRDEILNSRREPAIIVSRSSRGII